MKSVDKILSKIQLQVQRPYYFFLLGFVTMMDAFVLVIPTDGLLVTSVLGHPKAWFRNALATTVGSVLGSLLLASAIEFYGIDLLVTLAPGIETSSAWARSTDLMLNYGIYAIFLVGLSPLPQQPIVVIAALAKISLPLLGILLMSGRLLKYLIIAFVSAKSPDYVNKFRGIKKELEAAKKLSEK
jgi:membrane protein YqaA with SNARE-associated domain